MISDDQYFQFVKDMPWSGHGKKFISVSLIRSAYFVYQNLSTSTIQGLDKGMQP